MQLINKVLLSYKKARKEHADFHCYITLIFSTPVGSSHGVKFGCHYIQPPPRCYYEPIILLFVRCTRTWYRRVQVRCSREANSPSALAAGPGLHMIKGSLIKSCPQIAHLPSRDSAGGPSYAYRSTRTRTPRHAHTLHQTTLGFLPI